MNQKVDVPVSVLLYFNAKERSVRPLKLLWDAREYSISKIGLHHTYYQGKTFFHVYSVIANNVFFKLIFDTNTLFWRLEEISNEF